MDVSIIIICNQLRREKLHRLFLGIKPQLKAVPFSTEILLLHESNFTQKKPEFPIPVHYVNIPEKKGIPFNRNQGIQQARGKIVVYIDDDCWVPHQWLKALVQPLLADSRIMAVTGGTVVPTSTFLGDCISALGFPGGGSLGFEKMWRVSSEGFTNHLSVGNCALRKEVFENIGYFDESLKSGAEDTEFSFRLERAGISVKYIPEAFAYHEARTKISSFVLWQLRRGRANYQFKKKVNAIGGFVQLRFWSAKNILKANAFSWHFPLVVSLLGMSFTLQQLGYVQEKLTEVKEKYGQKKRKNN